MIVVKLFFTLIECSSLAIYTRYLAHVNDISQNLYIHADFCSVSFGSAHLLIIFVFFIVKLLHLTLCQNQLLTTRDINELDFTSCAKIVDIN